MLLTIELVPSTCWYSNVRSNVSASKWQTIKNYVFFKANNKCEICGGIGYKHQVECHEIWAYDDTTHTQTLMGCQALCPKCHQVKHIGLAMIQGRSKQAIKWLMHINNMSITQANHYIANAFAIHEQRSKIENWTLNIDWIDTIITK